MPKKNNTHVSTKTSKNKVGLTNNVKTSEFKKREKAEQSMKNGYHAVVDAMIQHKLIKKSDFRGHDVLDPVQCYNFLEGVHTAVLAYQQESERILKKIDESK